MKVFRFSKGREEAIEYKKNGNTKSNKNCISNQKQRNVPYKINNNNNNR